MAAIVSYRYFSKKFMDGLKHYKYSSVDTSPLANYVMKPWWEFFVKMFLPLTISANTLTFVGFLFGVSHFILIHIYDPYFKCSSANVPDTIVPDWVWLYGAVAHFLSHTLDGSDGIQARRTRTSSALGELMDHGLDSLSLTILMMTIPSLFIVATPGDLVAPEYPYVALSVTTIGFYLTHWEKYVTGILFLPWTYDIAMLTMQLLFLVTFITRDGVANMCYDLVGIEFYKVVVGGMVAGVIFSIPCTVWNIVAAKRKPTQYVKEYATLRQALRPLVPFAFMCVSYFALYWYLGALHEHPRLFLYSYGIVFSNMCTRLIVTQMCRQTFVMTNWLLIWPVLVYISVQYKLLSLYAAMWIMFSVLSVAHIHFAICLIRQYCHHLRIPCFAMRKPDP